MNPILFSVLLLVAIPYFHTDALKHPQTVSSKPVASSRVASDTTIYCFYEKKRITTSFMDSSLYKNKLHVFKIVDGNKRVFRCENRPADPTAGVGNTDFVFEVEPRGDFFYFTNKEMLAIKALYYYSNHSSFQSPDWNDFHIQRGYISGRKLNNGKWFIDINVRLKDLRGKKYPFKARGTYAECK